MKGRAGLWRRAAAILLDGVVSLAWTVPLMEESPARGSRGAFGLFLEMGTSRYQVVGGAFLLWVAVWFVYFIAMEALAGGTVGKLLLGIRVVAAGGGRIGLPASFVRNFLRVVDGFPYVIPYFVGWIVALTDKEGRRRVGDRLAKTHVVLKGARPSTGSPPAPPPPPVPV